MRAPDCPARSEISLAEFAERIHIVSMRIVTEPFLQKMGARYLEARPWLEAFRKNVRTARWKNLAELRRTYPHADLVTVESGRTIVVFNVAGNKYRLIAAVHFNRQIIFTLRLLTHAEYSKETWKNEL
jgi:mRNA interferase HigB